MRSARYAIRTRKRILKGFTLVELLVSLTILIIITIAVVEDISAARQKEELISSARLVTQELRNLQAMALSARGVDVCDTGTNIVVCEVDDTACGASSCDSVIAPAAFGATMNTTESALTMFAEVDALLEDRREDGNGRESLGERLFAEQVSGSNLVTIDSLTAGANPLTSATVTFERQSGSMRINACLSLPCTPAETNTLDIVLRHRQTGDVRTIRLNAVTGKVSFE